jgi:predicted kinase
MTDDDAAPTPTGHAHTRLIVIRGNSGSGKSTIARQLQLRHGRGCALVEQDYLRRIVLRERDHVGGAAAALIEHTARFALDHDYHVIVEGILRSGRYGDMLRGLRRAHRGQTTVFYLDVSLAETLRRHQNRPQAAEFTAEDMRGWYHPGDVLGTPGERVLPGSTSLDEAITIIAGASDLPASPLPSTGPSPSTGTADHRPAQSHEMP